MLTINKEIALSSKRMGNGERRRIDKWQGEKVGEEGTIDSRLGRTHLASSTASTLESNDAQAIYRLPHINALAAVAWVRSLFSFLLSRGPYSRELYPSPYWGTDLPIMATHHPSTCLVH